MLEFKAKNSDKEDYYQTQRYLQQTGYKLAILVNFRGKYIKPKRIVKMIIGKIRISIVSIIRVKFSVYRYQPIHCIDTATILLYTLTSKNTINLSVKSKIKPTN